MSRLYDELMRRCEGCEAVVFDVGNTLLEWSKVRIAEKYFPEEVRETLFHALFVKDHRWYWMCFDVGDLPQETVAMNIAVEAGCPEQAGVIMQAVDHFKETLQPMPLMDCLRDLKASGKRLFVLSNYPQPQADEALAMFPVFEIFDGRVISSDEKVCKPDKRIFDILCDRYGLKPETSLFVDDLTDNTSAARSFGFKVWNDFAAYYD